MLVPGRKNDVRPESLERVCLDLDRRRHLGLMDRRVGQKRRERRILKENVHQTFRSFAADRDLVGGDHGEQRC